MKKILCLVLIFVFCCNYCVFADGITDNEIQKLKDFGIVVGDPDGNLRLDDYVTVGEASKIICVIMGINDMSQTILPENFPLGYDNWASRYIYYMNLIEMVKIPENAEGYAENFISSADVIKMILKALGYLDSIKGEEITECLKLSTQLGITKGVSLIADENIKREDMAKLVINSLSVPIMAMSGYDAEKGPQFLVLNGKNGTELETLEIRLENNK